MKDEGRMAKSACCMVHRAWRMARGAGCMEHGAGRRAFTCHLGCYLFVPAFPINSPVKTASYNGVAEHAQGQVKLCQIDHQVLLKLTHFHCIVPTYCLKDELLFSLYSLGAMLMGLIHFSVGNRLYTHHFVK